MTPITCAYNWAEIHFKGSLITATRFTEIDGRTYGGKNKVVIHSRPSNAKSVLPGGEDPRFFVYRDRLHCYFTFVHARKNGKVARVRIVKLGDNLRPCASYHPVSYQPTEKNWCFFTHEDTPHAVYDLSRGRVLEFDDRFKMTKSYDNPGVTWDYGTIRGSTPPLRHGDRLVMFTHSWQRADRRRDGREAGRDSYKHYYIGFCELEPEPPFAVLRHSVHPIQLDEMSKYDVIFPGSARREQGGWRLACGFDDVRKGVVRVSDVQIELSMIARP